MTRPASRYWDSCEDLDRSTIESSSLKWRDVSLYTCFYPPFHIHKVHMCVKDTRNIKMKKKKKANIRTNDRWYCCCLFIYLFLVFLLLLFPYSICPLFIFYFYYFFFFLLLWKCAINRGCSVTVRWVNLALAFHLFLPLPMLAFLLHVWTTSPVRVSSVYTQSLGFFFKRVNYKTIHVAIWAN